MYVCMHLCMYVYVHEPSTGDGQNNGNSCEGFFNVLLTVHLSIILVINQLDAQNLVL